MAPVPVLGREPVRELALAKEQVLVPVLERAQVQGRELVLVPDRLHRTAR